MHQSIHVAMSTWTLGTKTVWTMKLHCVYKVPKVRSQAKTLRRMQRRKEVGILSVHAMPDIDQTWLNWALAHCISFPHCYYCVFCVLLVKVTHEFEIDRSQDTTWCGAKYTLKFWCNDGWIRSIPKAISPILTWVVTSMASCNCIIFEFSQWSHVSCSRAEASPSSTAFPTCHKGRAINLN